MKSELTPREIEVVQEMANGLSSEKIAEKLLISYNTVRSHKENIYHKLCCHDGEYAVAYCFRKRLIE
ncbi:response regulator transcription factor [Anaerosolibacter sp.]|uniref:response regulator transcription factor n=1 Tax=Anaerosolibacter sp. TaxID=1872527 RepID=UPI0039EFCB8F